MLRFDAISVAGHNHQRERRSSQDFAYAGEIAPSTVLAVVSDGCAGAPGASEIGAETMVQACIDACKQDSSKAFADIAFFERLHQCFERLRNGKSLDDYYATLVALIAGPSSMEFYIFGDGGWIWRRRDGIFELTQISWWRNRPYYLAYCSAGEDVSIREALDQSTILPVCVLSTQFRVNRGDIQVLQHSETWRPFDDFSRGFHCAVDPQEVELAAVMTDGVTELQGLSAKEVTGQIFERPDYEGAFVQRKIRESLTRLAARGQFAMDDIGVAAVLYC